MLGSQFDVVSLSLFLGMLALVPLIIVTTTSFLKVAVVLLMTRNALGVQQVPPNLAIYGIALAVSVFIMGPTMTEIGKRVTDVRAKMVDMRSGSALDEARNAFEPLQRFMMKYSRPEQRDIFLATAKKLWPKDQATDARPSDILILVPAFVVSELQTGYEVAFLIYIPFIVIDLLVSNLLMALGMQQVSPQTISMPLKLLLFVLVDGWGKLLSALALSYV